MSPVKSHSQGLATSVCRAPQSAPYWLGVIPDKNTMLYWRFYFFIYLSGCTGSWVQHAGSLVAACRIFSCSMLSCGIWDLVPRAVIETRPPVLGVWSLSHWTTRKTPAFVILNKMYFLQKKVSGPKTVYIFP